MEIRNIRRSVPRSFDMIVFSANVELEREGSGSLGEVGPRINLA